MSETREDKQRHYLERIETGGDLALTRYEPRDLPSLMDFSQMVARSQLCPQALHGKPQDVALVLMTGAERGFTAMQSLQNVYVIYGRASISASMLRALVLRDPQCEQFRATNLTDESATIVVRRKDWPEGVTEEVTYTVADAKKAGYYDRKDSRWPKEPGRMCLARATSVATDAYFPGVKAGLMELGEAEDLARESGASEAVTATATATAEKLAAGAKEAVKRAESDDDVIDVEEVQDDDGGDVVDAEYSDGDPLVPPGEAESDEQRFAHDLRRFVDGMGQKNTAALIGAGYDSIEKINAVGAKELAAVPGIGPKTVGALMEWAHKESTATEAQQAAQEKAEAPTEEDPKNEPAPAPVPDLPHRPNFRGPDYISALKNFAKDEGIPWADVVSEAGLISGGYPPEKLNDDEWKELGRWVRGGIAQKALLSDDDPDEGETTPAYRIGDVSGDLLTPDRVNTLLRYASREHLGVVGAQDEVGFERWLGETFGIGLATIPVEIEVLLMEWTASSKEDYEEELAAALLDGVLKEVAP